MCVRTLAEIIRSTTTVRLRECGKARRAGNSGARAEQRHTVAAVQARPNVNIISAKVLNAKPLSSAVWRVGTLAAEPCTSHVMGVRSVACALRLSGR